MFAFKQVGDLSYIDRGDYVKIITPQKVVEAWVHYQWQNRLLKRWFYFNDQQIFIN